MNKRGLPLTIRILYFSLALPFAKKKHFAPGVRGNLQYLFYMLFFHDQNQIRLIDDVGGQLPGLEPFGTVPTVFQNLARGRLHAFADPRRQACGGHADCRGCQCIAQQKFRCRTSADIAYANDKNLFEQGLLSRVMSIGQHALQIRMNPQDLPSLGNRFTR